MTVQQGSIPEVKEEVAGRAIEERTSKIKTFQDLGPPDLVCLTKQIPDKNNSEIGTFLYYTGLDNSSSSAVAAHLNQLANIIGSQPQPWFGKLKNYKVTKAVYASFNAFTRVDVVVTCHLPGAVSCFCIDGFGERIQETDRIWTEVFTSAIIRALLTAEEDDEQVNGVVESRNLNPFASVELAKQFFDAFETLFFEGSIVGCKPEVQQSTVIENYLVDAFLKAVELTGMYEYALEILSRLRQKDETVVSLIVKVLFLKDEEVKAVKTLYEGIQKNPRNATLLSIQSKFLVEKGKLDLALTSAIHAVNSAPSEFNTWANLAVVYLQNGQIEKSLLALNSCPMAAYKEKFHLKGIVQRRPESLHLPLPMDVHLDDVTAFDSQRVAQEHHEIDQSLINLQAANLKSTFAKAYDILTQIVHKTGWEALLKHRAKIFVMEEEYKSKSTSETNVAANGNGHSNPDEDSFKKKRLCERWLDNLFMLLYEDLKTYTMWQAEMIHFQAQKTNYKKLALEWELLGMCAFRLHHYKEASVAFQNALDQRFAPTSTRNLLKYYQMEAKELKKRQLHQLNNGVSNKVNSHTETANVNNQSSASIPDQVSSPSQITKKLQNLDFNILESIIKLTAWNHRWYCEFAPYLVISLSKVVERQGLVKIENEIKAIYDEKSGVSDLIGETFQFLKIFQKFGTEN